MRNLQRNAENGIKTALIDGAFEYLNPDYQEKVLTFADESLLEQLIIMSWRLPDNLNHSCSVHQIEFDFKTGSRIVERKEWTETN